MKKQYGLLSMIFGIASVLVPFIIVLPILAVLFAVLYKKNGDLKNESQDRLARIGMVMGTFMVALVLLIVIYFCLAVGGLVDFLALILALLGGAAAAGLCTWLYRRNWNNASLKEEA